MPEIDFDPDVREETPRIASPRAKGRWLGGMTVELTSHRHVYRADEPEHRGGADTGPTPLSMLMGALCA